MNVTKPRRASVKVPVVCQHDVKVCMCVSVSGLSIPGIPSALASLSVGHTGMAAAAASRLGLSGLAPTAGHNVLLVSNLNPQVSPRLALLFITIVSEPSV